MIISCPSCSSKFRVAIDAVGPDGRLVKCSKCGHVWQARTEDDESKAAPAAAAPPPAPTPAPASEAKPAPAPAPEAEAESATPVVEPEPPEVDESEEEAEPARRSVPEPTADFDEAPAEPVAANGSDGDEAPPPPPPPEPPPIPPRTEVAASGGAGRAPAVSFLLLCVVVAGGIVGAYFGRDFLVQAYPPVNTVYKLVGLEMPPVGSGLALATPEAMIEEGVLTIKGTVENTLGHEVKIPILRGALVDRNLQEIYVWTFNADDRTALPGEQVQYETQVDQIPSTDLNVTVTFVTEEEAAREGMSVNGTETSE